MGLALRRDTDGEYLLWTTRSGNGQSNAGNLRGWEPFTWNATTLADAIGDDPPGTLYSIDLVDAAHGGWGWVAMDSLTFTLRRPPLILSIAQSGDDLEFEWNSQSGMQYSLLSSTDLSTDQEAWLPYDDGTTIYQNIAASGTGTNILSGVAKNGPVRFFAVVEE